MKKNKYISSSPDDLTDEHLLDVFYRLTGIPKPILIHFIKKYNVDLNTFTIEDSNTELFRKRMYYTIRDFKIKQIMSKINTK